MFSRPENAFLRGLTDASFAALQPHLQPTQFAVGQLAYMPGDRVEWVYFPETCMMSLVTSTAAGETVETTMIGNEGAAGLIEACGSAGMGVQCFAQVDGRAFKTPAKVVRALVEQDAAFSHQAWKLVEFQIGEARQSGLCNAVHIVPNRLSRWLLETSERVGGRTQLPLTQEFIAAMLGVQRTTVNGVALQLRTLGLIDYRRGKIDLLDAAGLQSHACECRDATRALRERLGLELKPAAPVGDR